jgi:hypothetical protein
MFKAEDSIVELQLEKGMAAKTVDKSSLQGQSVELFRAAIKSQATHDPYERRLIGFLKIWMQNLEMYLLNLQK